MKREIKFRAWDKCFSKMIYEFTEDGYHVDMQEGCLAVGSYDGNYDWFELELMQYTGLKDKNGKDIYEGDIVHISKDGQVWSVEYDETEARFIVYNQLNSNRSFDFDYYQEYPDCPIVEICTANVFYPEVIGNIYENSELLK